MKQCPVCKSQCFDDMDVCYGCMHRFGEEVPGRPERRVVKDVPFEVEEPVIAQGARLQSPAAASAARSGDAATFVFPMEGAGFDLAISIRPASPCAAAADGTSIPAAGESGTAPRSVRSADTSEDIDMAELEGMVAGNALFDPVEALGNREESEAFVVA